MVRLYKSLGIGIGALVISTVAIQASDVLTGVRGNMLGSAIESTGACGIGAVQLNLSTGTLCVDQYEASPALTCPVSVPRDARETQDNMNEASCVPTSVAAVLPWRNLSQTQAQQLCARSGKRLPTAAEWYQIAVALADDSSCVTAGTSPQPTGSTECATSAGIYDLVGNVWEWVDAMVTDGTYTGRTLPESGYVAVVDPAGVVVETTNTPSIEYGADYAKTSESGTYGVIRGGFYGSGSDAGMFAQNLAVPLDLKTDGIGFRCVRGL